MHSSVVRTGRVGVAVFVVAVLAVAGLVPVSADHKPDDPNHAPSPVARPMEAAEPGWIWVPTAGPDRIFQPVSGHGVTVWYLDTIGPGAMFSLEPQRAPMGACTLGSCVQTLDFDILFYKRGDGGVSSVSERYESLGDEVGVVPSDAAFAFVFLKTPGALPDGAKGFGFVYRQGTPGHDRLPTIG